MDVDIVGAWRSEQLGRGKEKETERQKERGQGEKSMERCNT